VDNEITISYDIYNEITEKILVLDDMIKKHTDNEYYRGWKVGLEEALELLDFFRIL